MLKYLIFLLLLNNTVFCEESYFLTLRNDKVNLRQGPSFDYPIKIIYKKKYMPVVIQERSDNFRRIKDHENNSGWIHVSQLSKRKAAIILNENTILFKKDTIYSKPLARLEKGKLVLIKKCQLSWCKIKFENYSGWIKKISLWGRV
tara:strand:+ start:806 stop:1243 length:438 start_codon:yes stop_codon:yes gene_type:complete